MRRFFSPPEGFTSTGVTLDIDETRHLRDVLRLRQGEDVSVFDGTGKEFLCEVAKISKNDSSLTIIEEIEPASPESSFEITIAPTVLNGEKYDLIVQKAVELGVVSLIPLVTIRGDVKAKDAAKRLTRWRRIALEATKQTGRAKLMEIGEPVRFEDLVTSSREMVLFSERNGTSPFPSKFGKNITALYGPKGGWDDSELELAANKGVTIITLGGRILRAETAAIAITAILQHRFGDLN